MFAQDGQIDRIVAKLKQFLYLDQSKVILLFEIKIKQI